LSPAWVLAVAALIAALGGTAVAVDKITSKDIAKNAVRSKHIAAGQVRASDANVVRYARRAPTVASGVLTPVIGVRAKRGDLLTIHGRVDVRRQSGVTSCFVSVEIDGPISAVTPVAAVTNGSFFPYYVSAEGNGSILSARPITVPIVEPGRYRVSLAGAGSGGTVCEYRNRNLWVQILR
jgi:hypothetical protein